VFVAAANRVGIEKPLADLVAKSAGYEGIEFWGGSFVCDPFGRILGQAKNGQEQVLLVVCDLGLVEETRRHWPFLRDRRIDAYQGIDRRFMDKQV
jgi:N-carbamoylputrescine amidase